MYVIDSCFVKQRCYNPLLGLESLLIAPASKASAAQRAGRAGRVRPGHCFRLCTAENYQALMPAASVPEVQRSDLSGDAGAEGLTGWVEEKSYQSFHWSAVPKPLRGSAAALLFTPVNGLRIALCMKPSSACHLLPYTVACAATSLYHDSFRNSVWHWVSRLSVRHVLPAACSAA